VNKIEKFYSRVLFYGLIVLFAVPLLFAQVFDAVFIAFPVTIMELCRKAEAAVVAIEEKVRRAKAGN